MDCLPTVFPAHAKLHHQSDDENRLQFSHCYNVTYLEQPENKNKNVMKERLAKWRVLLLLGGRNRP